MSPCVRAASGHNGGSQVDGEWPLPVDGSQMYDAANEGFDTTNTPRVPNLHPFPRPSQESAFLFATLNPFLLVVEVDVGVYLVVVAVCPTHPMQQTGGFHDAFYFPSPNLSHDGVQKFQKVIRVTDHNANQIHSNRIPEYHTKRQHDPRQVRGIEGQKAQKRHLPRRESD